MRPQIVKKISLLFIHFFVCAVALGQQTPPPPPERTPGPQLPIDNHIIILILFGVLLGAYFLLRKKSVKL
tara:strand:- start:19562 stop:19771 length:210 start_codon:yes stop_codon:yes gene_type:complete